MRSFEWLAFACFMSVAASASTTQAARGRRLAAAATSAALALLIVLVARLGGDTVRAWLPHVYLVAGYWLPGSLAPAAWSPTAFERWLLRTDVALRPHLPSVPRRLLPCVELAYLFCYPLVPAAFGIVWMWGSAEDIDRFWMAVLIAGYACYLSLPWLVSRPPRLVDVLADGPLRIGSVNEFVLARVSHQLNTFPSGHVAVSFAAAAVVFSVAPVPGSLFASIAAAIGIGAAAGRYHYVVDVVLGIVVSALAVSLANA